MPRLTRDSTSWRAIPDDPISESRGRVHWHCEPHAAAVALMPRAPRSAMDHRRGTWRGPRRSSATRSRARAERLREVCRAAPSTWYPPRRTTTARCARSPVQRALLRAREIRGSYPFSAARQSLGFCAASDFQPRSRNSSAPAAHHTHPHSRATWRSQVPVAHCDRTSAATTAGRIPSPGNAPYRPPGRTPRAPATRIPDDARVRRAACR